MRTVLGTATAIALAAPFIVTDNALRTEWLSGTAIVVGAGVIYEILSRRWSFRFPKLQAGYVYPERCTRQVTLSARGGTPLAPVSILDDGNVYARDFGLRDTLLFAAYPRRAVFVLEPSSTAPDALPSFSPLLTRP
jgi:hypothetical protein